MKLRSLALTMLMIAAILSGCSSISGAQQSTVDMAPIPDLSGITAQGRLEPVHYIELAATVDSSVSEVLIKEGDSVKAGQMIALLKNSPPQPQANAPTSPAEPSMGQGKAPNVLDTKTVPLAVPPMANGYRIRIQISKSQGGQQLPSNASQNAAPSELSQAQTLEAAQVQAAQQLASAYEALRVAQKNLDDFQIPRNLVNLTPVRAAQTGLGELESARAAYEPYEDMTHKGYKPNNVFGDLPNSVLMDFDNFRGVPNSGTAREARKRLDVAWVNYRQAVQWLDLSSAVESAKADVDQAQQDYESLQDPSLAEDTAGVRAALATAELRAPFTGTVTNFDLKVGQFIKAGQPIATLADVSTWVVKTIDLSEIDVVNIKEGEPVTVTLDAAPDLTLKGYVLSLARNYSERQGDIVYKVTILLTDKDTAMRWGMTAHVQFEPTQ